MKKKKFLHTGKFSQRVRRSSGTERELRSLHSAKTSLWRVKQTEACQDVWSGHPALFSLRHVSPGAVRVWVLRLGLWRSELGRGLRLARGDSLTELGGGAHTKGVLEEDWTHHRGRCPPQRGCAKGRGGIATVVSFSACALRQQGTTYTGSGVGMSCHCYLWQQK